MPIEFQPYFFSSKGTRVLFPFYISFFQITLLIPSFLQTKSKLLSFSSWYKNLHGFIVKNTKPFQNAIIRKKTFSFLNWEKTWSPSLSVENKSFCGNKTFCVNFYSKYIYNFDQALSHICIIDTKNQPGFTGVLEKSIIQFVQDYPLLPSSLPD